MYHINTYKNDFEINSISTSDDDYSFIDASQEGYYNNVKMYIDDNIIITFL
jgi:hypothetical protein